MVDLLGLVLIMTVVAIGVLDLRSGLGPFAVYRAPAGTGRRRRTPADGHRGDDTQPRPPASAR